MREIQLHNGRAYDASFSPDGKYMATLGKLDLVVHELNGQGIQRSFPPIPRPKGSLIKKLYVDAKLDAFCPGNDKIYILSTGKVLDDLDSTFERSCRG